MTQQVTNPDPTTNDPLLTRINAQLNEERLVKDLSAVQLSRFKSLDETLLEISVSDRKEEIQTLLTDNFKEHSDSLVSRYILGLLILQDVGSDGITYLRTLLTDFSKLAKWTIVEHICDRILAIEDYNKTALRFKVDCTERLHGKKELKPILEKLATIDKKNPDIARKYAVSIIEEDLPKALIFLKQAGEAYARNQDYRNMEEIWSLIVQKDPKDIAWFEKIERILVGHREKTRLAALFSSVVTSYQKDEDWSSVILFLKKILEYEPTGVRARSELARAYKSRYEGHSLLSEFLKLSDLTNHKKEVGPCIANFERNIVFDLNNFVYHRTRGVGCIQSIDAEQMVIDFRDHPAQKMTIQMAISSLQPLGTNHLWVRYYKNPDEVKEIFEADTVMFFELLLSSFGKVMTLAEIKSEIAGKFIPVEEWSKWWSKTRTLLKKNPKFGFNPRKKDELILRENEISISEDMTLQFQSTADWNKKLELAVQTLAQSESEDAALECVRHYLHSEENPNALKRLQSYLFLDAADRYLGEEEVHQKITRKEIHTLFKEQTPQALVQFCADTQIPDFKKDIVNLIVKTREDYHEILYQILFELPIKINRYVLTELNRLDKTDVNKKFITRIFSRYREYPEHFLWCARGILATTNAWNYPWIEESKENVMLLVFRILKPLALIEKKGTRMKNSALEVIFGTTNITVENTINSPVTEIISAAPISTLRRMAALFKEVPYIPEAHKENFLDLIIKLRPDYTATVAGEDDELDRDDVEVLFPDENVILVSDSGLSRRKDYLDQLVNIDLPANARDIGEAQEKGDLRENAEYKAALERQSQLQTEITTVNNELKRAQSIDPSSVRTDLVTIGTKVKVETSTGETMDYTILGPWDADSDNFIISYVSPLGRSLIGKKVGESAVLESAKSYRILGITKAI